VYIYLRDKHLATIAQRVVLSIPHSIWSVYVKEINARMTPKEKAKELYDIYMDEMIEMEAYFFESAAKSCAKIAVNEIIKNGFNPQLQYNYWEEVKQEIEKL
jgi:hypothetical protein